MGLRVLRRTVMAFKSFPAGVSQVFRSRMTLMWESESLGFVAEDARAGICCAGLSSFK